MAEFVFPLLQMVMEKLASPVLSPVLDRFNGLYHLKDNAKKLQEELLMVQALLEDAQRIQATDEAVKIWLTKLKDAAYESENLLDELTVETITCQRRGSPRLQVSLLFPFEPSNHLFELALRLQNKLKEMEEVANKGLKLRLRKTVHRKPHACTKRMRETGSFVVKSRIYGREEEKEKLLELLLSTGRHGSERDYLVIPIVGIGGLGKTTLAQLVYNDENVAQYFDLKIWVYVSEIFDVRKIMIAMIESVAKRKCELLEMDLIQSQLQDALCGKRFFIVLDDVWNEDQEEWDKLGNLLSCGVLGSRVMVTTRSKKVASIMGCPSSDCLKGLSEDACWALFKERAFGEGEEQDPNLLAIGKQIIKRCGGIPLAAKSLGSVLQSKRDEKDWCFALEGELSELNNSQNFILPVLKWSYMQLPPHLKLCFAFCSLFPKGYEIKKEKMIHIWMAEGLILPSGGDRQLEDVGDEYFSALLFLSFFKEVTKNDDSGMVVYNMHDLVHDLARDVGGKEFLIFGQNSVPSNSQHIRHSSVVSTFDPSSFPEDCFSIERLRTLIFLFPGGSSGDSAFLPPASFIYLRILDLSGCGIKKLHQSICALICLRYLDLSTTSIQELPHTICNFYNLQTLNLSGCYNLEELPFAMSNAINLRHINTEGCCRLTSIPARIGNLVHLQTFPIYIVGKELGKSIAELNALNLRGELRIKQLENVKDAEEAKLANLREKKYLQVLRLQWGCTYEFENSKPSRDHGPSTSLSLPGNNINNVEDIIQNLEPHVNLKKLYVEGYTGAAFPHWDLPNLVDLVLVNCKRCKNLPILGQLPYLKSLCLQGMHSITTISREFYGRETQKPFASLNDLKLVDFPVLVEWSSIEYKETFPCLQKLIVEKCPNLMAVPVFPCLKHLELHHCHANLLNSMEKTTSLSTLVIDKFLELRYLPGKLLESNKHLVYLEIRSCNSLLLLPPELEKLTVLKSLIINSCEELSHIPPGLQNLKVLESWEINGCHNLIMLPEEGIGGLSFLKNLSIENCHNLVSLSRGMNHLTALQHLTIMGCPKLDFSPDSLSNLSALCSLSIISCPEVFSLPSSLQQSKKLQSLVIHSCPGLTFLPDWLEGFSHLRSLAILNCQNMISLPRGLQHLTSLQHLSLQDCPHLERLCKQRGKEWQKIAHVPYKYIGSLKTRN